jgi:DUF4097 and DUF4098 domain-containing protein YvlB
MLHTRLVCTIFRATVGVAAVVSLTACDVVVNTMEGGKATAADQWSRTFTLATDGQVEVVNVNGRIDVEGVDGTTMDVKAEITVRSGTDEAARELLKQVEIREENANGRVRLETRYPKGLGRSNVDVKYTLRVPRAVGVNVETTNGSIVLNQLTGRVRAESTNGAVDGRNLSGAVSASTTNGGVDIAVTSLAPDGVTLETTNGSVSLTVPSDAKGTISARCVNGGIKVKDLDVETTETSRRRLEGTLNGGGPAIKLETVNGGIRLGRSSGPVNE